MRRLVVVGRPLGVRRCDAAFFLWFFLWLPNPTSTDIKDSVKAPYSKVATRPQEAQKEKKAASKRRTPKRSAAEVEAREGRLCAASFPRPMVNTVLSKSNHHPGGGRKPAASKAASWVAWTHKAGHRYIERTVCR